MGLHFVDKYSLLHFAVGIIFRFFNIDFITSLILHILFEIIENTKAGVHFIDHYLTFWPGGKQKADSFINCVGDTVFFILGWFIANIIIK
jgi:hypothetical protein